jgi:hypothetical protein
MRKKNRSFLLMSLISASLLVSVFTIVQAQSPAAPAVKATNWSDPATWPNRKVPVAGDKVIIEKEKQVGTSAVKVGMIKWRVPTAVARLTHAGCSVNGGRSYSGVRLGTCRRFCDAGRLMWCRLPPGCYWLGLRHSDGE